MNDLINIENKILVIRGQQVMLDRDLAELYDVETKALNQAVKRNIERFPGQFMFQLDNKDISSISSRSQFVTLKNGSSRGSNINIFHMHSQNKVWPCFLQFYEVLQQFKSASRLWKLSLPCEDYYFLMHNYFNV